MGFVSDGTLFPFYSALLLARTHREQKAFPLRVRVVSQMASWPLYSVLLLITAHMDLVKSSALYREYGAIWDGTF